MLKPRQDLAAELHGDNEWLRRYFSMGRYWPEPECPIDLAALMSNPSTATLKAVELMPAHRLWYAMTTLDPVRGALLVNSLRAGIKWTKRLEKARRVRIKDIASKLRPLQELPYQLNATLYSSIEFERHLQRLVDVVERDLARAEQRADRKHSWQDSQMIKKHSVVGFRADHWGKVESALDDEGWEHDDIVELVRSSATDFQCPPCPNFLANHTSDDTLRRRLYKFRGEHEVHEPIYNNQGEPDGGGG